MLGYFVRPKLVSIINIIIHTYTPIHTHTHTHTLQIHSSCIIIIRKRAANDQKAQDTKKIRAKLPQSMNQQQKKETQEESMSQSLCALLGEFAQNGQSLHNFRVQ